MFGSGSCKIHFHFSDCMHPINTKLVTLKTRERMQQGESVHVRLSLSNLKSLDYSWGHMKFTSEVNLSLCEALFFPSFSEV